MDPAPRVRRAGRLAQRGDRMRHWSDLARFHWSVLILGMALASVSIAWNSFDLLMLSMANLQFLETFGWMAVTHGGLVQSALIVGQALVVLFSYLAFKGIEVELMQRWRAKACRPEDLSRD